MSAIGAPRPLRGVRFFTAGTTVLAVLAAVGAGFALWRFAFGLGSTTNLSDQYPWGIWIGIDVATGVALAAGGFTVSALAHLFHRSSYLAVVRPALLTALLGYTFVVLGLLVDLGRPTRIWYPLVFWQGNSVLFEVGLCVVGYLLVLYLEFLPVLLERLRELAAARGWTRWRRLAEHLDTLRGLGRAALLALVLLGVVLSCLHQSSLGALMLIAPTKMHALWSTPVLPLLFLLSAVAAGFAVVLLEAHLTTGAFRLEPEPEVLAGLARLLAAALGLSLAARLVDLTVREAWVLCAAQGVEALALGAELGLGLALPLGLLLSSRVRTAPGWRALAAGLVVLGVALNRVNVFLLAYQPPYTRTPYVPALGEVAVTVGLIASLVLVYRAAVIYLPVVSLRQRPR